MSSAENQSNSALGKGAKVDIQAIRQKLESDEEFTGNDLKASLQQLLEEFVEATKSLSEAHARAIDLEHKAKVAQSNLALTEANCDMLEEALKKGGQAGAFGNQIRNSSNPPTPPPPPQSALSAGSGSSFGLSSFRSRKTSNNSHPPSSLRPLSNESLDPHAAGPPPPHTRSISYTTGSSLPGGNSSATQDFENAALRNTINALQGDLSAAHKALATAAKEQAHLQEQKTLLEGEIENLSVSLFEEANNMVAEADRLQKIAERQAEDARNERDAIKVALRLVEEQVAISTERSRALESLLSQHAVTVEPAVIASTLASPEPSVLSPTIIPSQIQLPQSPETKSKSSRNSIQVPIQPKPQQTLAASPGTTDQKSSPPIPDVLPKLEPLSGSPILAPTSRWFSFGTSRSSSPAPGYGQLISDESSPAARADQEVLKAEGVSSGP